MSLMERMFRLPFTMFSSGMDMLMRGMRGRSNSSGDQCLDSVVSRMAHPCTPAGEFKWRPCEGETKGATTGWVRDRCTGESSSTWQASAANGNSYSNSRSGSLNDEGLKLVRYKVLFVKRDLETVLEQRDELVSDKLDDQDFISWKTAEFMQRLSTVNAPARWVQKKYPQEYRAGAESKLQSIPDDDQKYLRVYFEIIDTYPREDFRYDEREIDALEGIRDAIKES
jgi:hypothetical protein